MSERRQPTWLDRAWVDAMHLEQLQEHGGLPGIRDENALESALMRPQQRWHHEPGADLCELAAAYAFGIARNHPYRDGNKRAAFMAMAVFLELNDLVFVASETEVVAVMLDLSAGHMDEAALAAWLRERGT